MSQREGLLVLRACDVSDLLRGRERDVVEIVRRAYLAHVEGHTALPHSVFLRFDHRPADRIIALPAYLGGEFDIAGIKWIASFPGNLTRQLDRASALVVLNSMATGRAECLLEGAGISAARTAASAALAAAVLHRARPPVAIGLIGCGVINFEILRFLRATMSAIDRVAVYDLAPEHAHRFAERCHALAPELTTSVAASLEAVLEGSQLVSFATTASAPYVGDLAGCAPGTTVLHVSLRDLSIETIAASDNVVDDEDHVCRAQTSVHLAAEARGNREFIRCTLGDVLSGRAAPRRRDEDTVVFSPFGLGILDLAVSRFVVERARAQGVGLQVEDFFGEPWRHSSIDRLACAP